MMPRAGCMSGQPASERAQDPRQRPRVGDGGSCGQRPLRRQIGPVRREPQSAIQLRLRRIAATSESRAGTRSGASARARSGVRRLERGQQLDVDAAEAAVAHARARGRPVALAMTIAATSGDQRRRTRVAFDPPRSRSCPGLPSLSGASASASVPHESVAAGLGAVAEHPVGTLRAPIGSCGLHRAQLHRVGARLERPPGCATRRPTRPAAAEGRRWWCSIAVGMVREVVVDA